MQSIVETVPSPWTFPTNHLLIISSHSPSQLALSWASHIIYPISLSCNSSSCHKTYQANLLISFQFHLSISCPSPPVRFCTEQMKPVLNKIFVMFFIGFPIIHTHSTTFHKHWIYQTTCKGRAIKLIIILYTYI